MLVYYKRAGHFLGRSRPAAREYLEIENMEEPPMELSRRDFLRSTAAFAAVASVLGTSSIAFAADADENCNVNI